MPALPVKRTISWEQYDEACSELRDTLEENRRLGEECRYMSDYIHQRGLDTEFALFQQTAHEECDSDLPFPHLVMDMP